MKILIVEDSSTDRELLRYLLEARFANEARFSEAANLADAILTLEQGTVDCVILDLQLPDSAGKATFMRLYERYPHVPIIVMTHNKDRQLAIDMIQAGAADYIIKNFTEEEELFRRILFAIEKHSRTIRCSADNVVAVRKLEKAQAEMIIARRSNSIPNMQAASMGATEAITEVSRKVFTELAGVSAQLARQVAQQEHVARVVENLDKELLRGHSNRPSMRSQMDLFEHRMGGIEMGLQSVKNNVNEVETTQQRAALQVTTTRLTNRTKVLLGILALVGSISAAVIGYYETIHKPADTSTEKKAK